MMALSSLNVGKISTIACLKTDDGAIVRKLMAMGIMPGMTITLEQRFPSYVLKVGKTRAAIDWQTAETIYVEEVKEHGE